MNTLKIRLEFDDEKRHTVIEVDANKSTFKMIDGDILYPVEVDFINKIIQSIPSDRYNKQRKSCDT